MRRLAVVALFAVACGAAQVHAQTLALAYHSGGVYKYKLHSTSNEAITEAAMNIPVKTELSALETATVKSVDASGVADLSIALSAITMKATYGTTASTTTGLTLPAVELKIAADGRVLSVNGISAVGALSFGAGAGGNIVSAVLPDTPVKPGDTWSKTYDEANPIASIGSGSGGIHVTTTSKYLRDESFQGVNAAVVETKSNATIDFTLDTSKLAQTGSGTAPPFQVPIGATVGMTLKGTVTSDTTTWIDPSGRRIMKSHMTSNTTVNMNIVQAPGATTPSALGPMSISGDQTLDLSPA